MTANTKIEWADHTFNPWIGCTQVSPACDHCYAERSTPARTLGVAWGAGQPRRRTAPSNWAQPLAWQRKADAFMAQHGRRQRVFCASLADVFDNEVDPQWRQNLMSLIARTPNLDWLLLTKRIGNARRMLFNASMHDGLLLTANDEYQPPANLWLGATVVTQEEADRDIPKLLAIPAAKRFLSIEPLLGPVDLTSVHVGGGHGHHEFDPIITGNVLRRAHPEDPSVNWVIVGGESGPGARECHVSHIRSIVQQCKAANVPVFVKQLGAQPRGWCAANVHIDPAEAAELDADHCDLYEANESRPCSGRCVLFDDKKGGDPAEWPEDLRVREFPTHTPRPPDSTKQCCLCGSTTHTAAHCPRARP